MAITARSDDPHPLETIAAERFAQDVWGYVRQHKDSLHSTQHMEWLENRVGKLINVCDRRAIALEKKCKSLSWFVDNIHKDRRMFRKNMTRFSERNKAYDKEVCHVVVDLGATITMASKVFHTSGGVIRQILRENGHKIDGLGYSKTDEYDYADT
jgi:hypothetical protein